ncbi:MAG: nuclear transport factor 2 family protein [Rhizomicrobium sp.]
MTPEDDIRARTLQLVGAYRTLMAEGRWDAWIDLWCEDGVLEFPFAPAGRRPTYRGRRDILDYMKAASGKIAIDAVARARIFPMQDPTVAVAEFAIKGRALSTGAPYDQRYVVFFETRDGKLAHYREYWNPLVSMAAFGEGWATAFGAPQ